MKNINSTETCADGRCEKQEGVDYQRDYTRSPLGVRHEKEETQTNEL
jgi:hypothetical protein